MSKRKELATLIYESRYIGCGCCTESAPDNWDEDGNYIPSEVAKLSDEWGIPERYIRIADEILAGLGETA